MAYLRFARNHADYFSVMFESGLERGKYPEIERSAKAGFGVIVSLAQQYERTPEPLANSTTLIRRSGHFLMKRCNTISR